MELFLFRTCSYLKVMPYFFSIDSAVSALNELFYNVNFLWAVKDDRWMGNRVPPLCRFSGLCIRVIWLLISNTVIAFLEMILISEEEGVPFVFCFCFCFPLICLRHSFACALFEKDPWCFHAFWFDLCNKLVALHPPHPPLWPFLFHGSLFFSIFHSPKHANHFR